MPAYVGQRLPEDVHQLVRHRPPGLLAHLRHPQVDPQLRRHTPVLPDEPREHLLERPVLVGRPHLVHDGPQGAVHPRQGVDEQVVAHRAVRRVLGAGERVARILQRLVVQRAGDAPSLGVARLLEPAHRP
jgi:hypothetical protein